MKKSIVMWARRRISYFFPIFSLVILLMFPRLILGQENLLLYTTKVTVSAVNEPVINILNKIEQRNNLTFSYKSGLIDENVKRTFVVTNLPLYNALDSLFKTDSLEYYPLGRQVVIYKPTGFVKTKKIIVRDTLVRNVLRKDTVQIKVIKRDTVIQFKTDTVFDTIFVKEPFAVFDTVFMDKPSIQFLAFYNINNIYANNTFSRSDWNLPQTEYENGENSGYLYRLGLLAQVNLTQNLYLKSGVGFGKRYWNANYNFTAYTIDSTHIVDFNTQVTPIITKRDSIPLYFPGADTLWYFYYDTTYNTVSNPKYKEDSVAQKYNGENELLFMTIPLYFGFETPISEKLKVFGEVGVLVDFILSRKGKSLSDSPYGELVPLSDLPFSPINAYFSMGAGVEYKWKPALSVFVKLNLDFQLNSEFSKQYPVSQRKNALGLTVGLKF